MKPARKCVAHGFIVFALLMGCACGSSTTSSSASPASPSVSGVAGSGKLDPAVSMPNGFPSDFPVYPGSRLTVAGQVTANGQTTWGLQWETLDSVDAVQAFYVKKLNEGDWTLTYNASSNGGFSAIFSRKGNQKDAGILTVELESEVTHIALAFGVNG